MRHRQVFTVASSAVLEKFANRVLTRNFDQIAFAKSHCWHRFNWFGQPHFIRPPRLLVRPFWKPPLPVLLVMLRTCIGEAAVYIAKILRDEGERLSDKATD